tara:strand:+ start:6000 stop:7082 length:1083 start_codon:yes stop_codon:yes gene_type:complete
MNQVTLFAALLFTLTSSLSVVASEKEPESEDTALTEAQGIPVTQVKASQMNMISLTKVRGEIESPEKPNIASKLDAEVIAVMFDEGMSVKAGSLLARLDSEEFQIAEEKAKANIERIQALIEGQQRELKQNQNLLRKRLISQSAVDDAVTALKQSEAELLVTKASLKNVRYQLSHSRITSPINGKIQKRNVSKGDYVKKGDLLFQLASTENLRARLFFPESLANSIHLGMDVKLTGSGQTTMGKINRIRPMLEDGNRALHALVEFPNNEQWKPGASVVAQVSLETHENAVTVPEKTLVRRPAGMVVYKINGDTVSEHLVTTGLKEGNMVEIRSGLNSGDMIVLDGAAWLTDGVSISIQDN